MHINENILLGLLKKGDDRAYKFLFDHHYAVLCKYANELIQDPFIAETIVGDLIFHLWEIREKIEITTSLRTYLMRATRNRCYNYLTQKNVQHETSLSQLDIKFLDNYTDSKEHPLGMLLEKELEDEIICSVNRLNPECKRVFMESRFENKKNEEIAAELGISINTVKYHIKNALASIRQDLEKYITALIFLHTNFF
ncbi:MAG: RNA polymerase sigma-70 factor [Tannerellaceae bacterium]